MSEFSLQRNIGRPHLQDVLLGAIEEEDDAVVKRSGLVGQRVEDLQHDGAAHRVVAGTCGEGEQRLQFGSALHCRFTVHTQRLRSHCKQI